VPWDLVISNQYGGDSEQPVPPKRVADADDVVGRIVIEAEGDVKIDLLRPRQPVSGAGIEELAL